MTVEDFYDEMAEYYHLIFPNWHRSMSRQGAAISKILLASVPFTPPERFRVLDVAAGIGTQALPLASLGFVVTARDLSRQAIQRLDQEAHELGLRLDTGVADMRSVAATVQAGFDAVIAFDNALPHLLSDADILSACESFYALLEPGGVLVLSVRDYDQVDRSPTSIHPYGQREDHGRTFRFRQEWTWLDADRYETTFIGEEHVNNGWIEKVRTTSEYYAISVTRLLGLMEQAGFKASRASPDFYQPVLVGRRAV